jgi:hypothetical protein
MSEAEDFRHKLIALRALNRDEVERTGICPNTAAAFVQDPLWRFQIMTVGERAKLWVAVEAYLETKREASREYVGQFGAYSP